MNLPKLATITVPVAAAVGWSAWLLADGPDAQLRVIVLTAVIGISVAAYLGSRRKEEVPAFRFGIFSAALIVCGTSVWTEVAVPISAIGVPALLSWLRRTDLYGVALTAGPPAGFGIIFLMWSEVAVHALKRLSPDDLRPRSRSELYGRASLLGRAHLRRLACRNGILLGQWGAGPRAPLIGWALEGSAITVAPPRTGKGATITLNMLSPGSRGFSGSTVLVDPRGEIWCVAARRRREMGRRVVLLDPFGVVARHKAQFPDAHIPDSVSATYNPFDFIRENEAHAVRDINVLLDALLTPPAPGAQDNARHFYESARSLIGGYMAWIRFKEERPDRNLGHLHQLLSMNAEDQQEFARHVLEQPPFCGNLAHLAIERQSRVGKEEGGSNFTTIANQLSFMTYPEMAAHTSSSTVDPLDLAAGDTDLFVVAPEEQIDHIKGWIRLWITIPAAIADIRALERDMLIVIDEMPRLGFLKPVMDAYTMAAGKGVHFWCFAQSLSALDTSWGKDNRKTLTHLAELIQILGFPRIDADGAEEFSKTIGHATFESRSESRSGSTSDARVFTGGANIQAGDSLQPVRERVVTPDDLMTLGPDRQYVIASPKDMPQDALHLHHSRYWTRPDSRSHADPNPFVVRKKRAAGRQPRLSRAET